MATKQELDRLRELSKPIDQQLMMVDDQNELLMLASYMIVTAKGIFDLTLGEEGRKKMFKDYV